MRISLVGVLLATSLLIAGCAGTSAQIQSDSRSLTGSKIGLELSVPSSAKEEGVNILRERLLEQLSQGGISVKASGSVDQVAEITVTNYRFRHGATRALVGAMAGSDSLRSVTKLKDPTTGDILMEFTVNSKNPSAWGSARGLIEEHADKIVEIIRGRRG